MRLGRVNSRFALTMTGRMVLAMVFAAVDALHHKKRGDMVISLALGAMVGIILALTGAGGGILAVPLLVFGVHLSMAQAGPIGLMAVSLAATLGAVMGLRQGIVRYKAAMLVASAGMMMSPLGLWLAHLLPNRPLTLGFAALLMWVSYRSYRQVSHGAAVLTQEGAARPVPCRLDPDTGRFIWTFVCARTFFGAGIIAGFLSGLLGVGGGFIMVPTLQRCTNLTMQSVVATSLAVMCLVSASGVLASALAGHMVWAVALPFSAGALAGMLAGRLLSPRVPGAYLNQGFALVAALVAVGMLLKAIL